MKLEDALAAMRSGAKIWHPGMPEDEYYVACYIVIDLPIFYNNGQQANDPLEDAKERGMSIAWMKSGKEHPEYRPKWNMYDPKTDPCKHGFHPMINLLWIMSDEWEIL